MMSFYRKAFTALLVGACLSSPAVFAQQSTAQQSMPGQSTVQQSAPRPSSSAADASALSPAQVEAVNKLIRNYYMQHPDDLVAALKNADDQAREQEQNKSRQAVAANRQALDEDPTAPVLGNPKGGITLVEFFDYRCPYCKATAAAVQGLIDQNSNVRVVMKEFPILGKDSVLASEVALVAQKHGRYAAYHTAMFALKTPVTEDRIYEVAKEVGLDAEATRKEIAGSDIQDILKNNMALAEKIGVNGTPAFVIGGDLLPGALTLPELKAAVAAQKS